MRKHQNADWEAQKKAPDSTTKKRTSWRPQAIPPEWIIERADNGRWRLAQVWKSLSRPLLAAKNEAQVSAAFEEHGQPYASEFVPRSASDLLKLITDPLFPKRAEARIDFLADSLAGRSVVTMRTSRDICSKQRAKRRAQSMHSIIRYEFYVQCGCGYEGPARDNACRECGASISFGSEKAFRGF